MQELQNELRQALKCLNGEEASSKARAGVVHPLPFDAIPHIDAFVEREGIDQGGDGQRRLERRSGAMTATVPYLVTRHPSPSSSPSAKETAK